MGFTREWLQIRPSHEKKTGNANNSGVGKDENLIVRNFLSNGFRDVTY